MQWNDLDYETQRQVISQIGDLMLKQTDERLQFAMAAAMVELDMWSNTPCPIIARDEKGQYVAQAADPYTEDE